MGLIVYFLMKVKKTNESMIILWTEYIYWLLQLPVQTVKLLNLDYHR